MSRQGHGVLGMPTDLDLVMKSLARIALLASLALPSYGQEELLRFQAPHKKENARFGLILDVGHGRILVGGPLGGKQYSGRVHMFDLRTGEHLGVLFARERLFNDYFGSYITIGEKWVLISSRRAGSLDSSSGAVHVFDPRTWEQVARITPPDGNHAQQFGSRTAVHRNLALIGAPSDNILGTGAGAAHLVQVPSGKLIQRFYGNDTGNLRSHHFGSAVALTADRALVSAHFNDERRGSTYVFDLASGKQLLKLQGSQTHPEAYFGYPIAVHGEHLLIGSYAEDDQGLDRAGAAYLFNLYTGVELRRFSNALPAEDANYGRTLDLNAQHALIAAPAYGGTLGLPGSVHMYDLATGVLLETFRPADSARADHFGLPVVLEDCRAVIGSSGYSEPEAWAGAGYVFLIKEDLGQNYCGPANPNSTGQPALISATGCSQASENRLTLEAANLPAHKLGYFIASRVQGFTPLPPGSQGNLCLDGSLARFTTQANSSGAAGQLTLRVDLTVIPTTPLHNVLAGETWNFQAWFRDNLGGPTSNFTDGISITFR